MALHEARRPAVSRTSRSWAKRAQIAVAGALVLVGLNACGPTGGAASSSGTQLTIMSNPTTWEGFTKKTSSGSNSIASWYTYYHSIWKKAFPKLTIKEVQVPDDQTEITKAMLQVEAHDPPDLIAFHEQLPELVQRGVLTNLTPYFKRAGISQGDLMAPLARFSRYNGQWYAMPGASSPTVNDIFFIPQYVQAAGISPAAVPHTWAGLWQATQKVTKWGPNHTLARIGEPVIEPTDEALIASFCGGTDEMWNARTGWHVNAPCVKSFTAYEKKLVDFYGGWKAYEKFIHGDPGPWSCSKSDYMATGKTLFDPTFAYWDGVQFDRCYHQKWSMTWMPTRDGTLSEAKSMQQTQWFVGIPKGAQHPQLAFDFWKKTIYDNGQLTGPTTNGYVRPAQAKSWWSDLVRTEGKTRKQHGSQGNPMAGLVPMELKEAARADWAYPRSTINDQVTTTLNDAWNNIMYKGQSVTTALNAAQKTVAGQEHSSPGGVLTK